MIANNIYAVVALLAAAGVGAVTTPECLAKCMKEVTNPCTSQSLPTLINCLDTSCSDTAQEAVVANIHVSYTPKAQYSCQDSFVPNSDTQSADPMTLSGDGECKTAPYAFQSFIASDASPGIEDTSCNVMVYDEDDCKGNGKKVDMTGTTANGCQFTGGKSAMLDCPAQNKTAEIAQAELASLCANSSSSSVSAYSTPKVTGTTALYPTNVNSNSSVMATSSMMPSSSSAMGSATSASSTSSMSASASSSPVTGFANMVSTADASLAGLLAVAAALLAI